MAAMHIPEHYLRIREGLYLEPDPEDELEFDPPDQLDPEWTRSAAAALAAFSREIPAWRQRAGQYGRMALRIPLGDDFVNERIFDHETLPADPEIEAGLVAFIDAVTDANLSGELWCDSENHLGGDLAARLAERSPDHIVRFVRFLESNDLDHEVSQAWHIMRVMKAHGWRAETMALWVARLGTCAGQHGHETPWTECFEQSLADYIVGDPERRTLLIRLMAGNMVAQLNYLSKSSVEHNLNELADDVLDIFWDDLDEQGLGELAAAVLEEAHGRAQTLVREYGGPDRPRPPHWLSVLNA